MTTNTVPTAMDDVIANGMAKNPDHRYPSTRDLALAARNAITAPIATPPLNYGPTVAHQHTHFAPPPQHSHVPLTQQAQSTLAPPQPPPKTGSKAKAIWITVASALTLLALVAATAIALTRHDSTPTATTSAAPSASDQPLTGSLRADFGALTDIAGKPVDNAGPTTETWTFRSTCPGGGCVATAAAGGPITAAPNWVFDEVDGQWLAVSVAPGKCQDLDAEFWRVIRLKKAADGSLTGQLVSAANVGCTTVRSLNMTRIGDADVTQLADPSSLPPRVPSPAEAFHGVYHQTLAFSPTDTYHYNYAVQTSCLRTGDRCASVLSDTDTNADQVRVWVFAGAKWSQYNDYSGICPGVGLNHFRDTAEYPLPQPAQDPINAITGKGTRQVPDGGLCVRGDFTSTLQRTGD
jgi:serine/threonine-protein kinase